MQYPVVIGSDILKQASLLLPHCQLDNVFVVSQQTIAIHYLSVLEQSFTNCNKFSHLILNDGEQAKNLQSMTLIVERLLAEEFPRDSLLIALGGGVIGDLTGFVAACYMRGVPYVQIPTTLLAQVDAAIGGKTAVNLPNAKNILGAFHQPEAVLIDIDTLNTLPDREYIAGFAEVIKAALIADAKFFDWLGENRLALLQRDATVLEKMISSAVNIKQQIVRQDQYDRGVRRLLNLGHTFAHALETLSNYKQYLHGEAVAIGIHLAAKISEQIGCLARNELDSITELLAAFKLPYSWPADISFEDMLETIKLDKKVLSKQQHFVLLRAIGQAYIEPQVASTTLQDSFNTVQVEKQISEES